MGAVPHSRERLIAGLDGMREGFQIVDHDWRYIYVNQAACHHAQLRCDELLGQRMTDVYPGIEATEMFAELERCKREGVSHAMENEFTYPDGSRRWYDLRLTPIPEGVVILSVDITAHKLLERQVHESQRLEAVGRLAGGLAHDFNNLITAIDGFVSFAKRRLDKGGDPRKEIDGISDATRRAAELTRHLLEFARRRPVRPRALNVNHVLEESQHILRRLVGREVQLDLRRGDDLWNAYIDAGALEQVLMNLAANARDAMERGGMLVITTSNVTLDDAYSLGKQGEVPPGDYVCITVSDEGSGMTPEVQEQAFEPFFTTKPEGVGTGLGLSTCFGIVRQAGGYIWLYSEPGQGTTFKIYLPRRDGPADFARKPPRRATTVTRPELQGKETVLVVEDDDQVRAVARRALTQCGYQVIEASNPEQAVRITRGGIQIDLLVTDVVLPKMNGAQLAAEARQSQPDLRVLYVSGYGDDALPARGPRPSGRLLQKPFGLTSLARAVREVLDAGRAPQ